MKSVASGVHVSIKFVQKRTAPTSPKRPAIPKVDTEEPRVALLVLLGVLPLEVLVAEPESVVVALLAAPEELPLVGEVEPDPESLIAVLRQLVLEPATIVAWPEKA